MKLHKTDLSAFTSITAAVIICMIGLGVQHPGGMPVKAFVQSDLVTAFSAVTNIIFAYSKTSSCPITRKNLSDME